MLSKKRNQTTSPPSRIGLVTFIWMGEKSRWPHHDKGIELYYKNWRAHWWCFLHKRDGTSVLYARWIWNTRWSLWLLNATRCCFVNLENGRLRACRVAYIGQCALLFLYNSMTLTKEMPFSKFSMVQAWCKASFSLTTIWGENCRIQPPLFQPLKNKLASNLIRKWDTSSLLIFCCCEQWVKQW